MARRYRRFGGNEDLVVVAPPRERPPDPKPDPKVVEIVETIRKPRSED